MEGQMKLAPSRLRQLDAGSLVDERGLGYREEKRG
jgi:hypothetical protein